MTTQTGPCCVRYETDQNRGPLPEHILQPPRILLRQSGVEVVKLFSCSIQVSTKFQLLVKTKTLKIAIFLAFKHSDVVFIMLINVKMITIVTIVNILRFMSMINTMQS